MDWRDEYQMGSFRGTPFRTVDHEHAGGRRVALHEYPGRDEPTAEDLGRKARQYSLELFVVGRSYFRDRNALIDALEAEGPGLLVHPFLGERQVVVLDFTLSESTEEGGMARFSVQFAEAGVAIANSQAPDAQTQATSAADSAADIAPQRFADRFSIERLPSFIEDAASDLISGAATISQLAAAAGGGAGTALRIFQSSLDFLPNLSALLRTPLDLGQAIVHMVQSVKLVTGTTKRTIAAYSRMADYSPALPVTPATPTRTRQAENREAFLHLFRHIAMAETVRTIAESDFASREDAVAVRDATAVRLDALALAAADAGEDARVEDLDTLRRAMVRDISQRVPGLARLQSFVPQATRPALAIANRLYGHADAARMADDIVARNRVRHPGFAPGGIALKVLTDAA